MVTFSALKTPICDRKIGKDCSTSLSGIHYCSL
jgi:hypothetical protein